MILKLIKDRVQSIAQALSLDQVSLDAELFVLLIIWLLLFLWLLNVRARRKQSLQSVESEREEIALKAEVPKDEPALLEKASAKSAAPAASKPATTFFSGLEKTRKQFFNNLLGIFSSGKAAAQIYEDLEEVLIGSDLGVKTSQKILTYVKEEVSRAGGSVDVGLVQDLLKGRILQILASDLPPGITPQKNNAKPLVILVVGVNGVGKTTTIGKLAERFSSQGARVLIGACDTFRAAAVEQIDIWAKRAGVELVSGAEGAKPSTVAYQTIHRGLAGNFDVVILDTAGRLHTRVNLMNELEAVVKLIDREQSGAPHEILLVVDAATGQNALQQAREFNQRAKLTGVVVTKLDGTPKGGIVVALKDELGIPIRYVGVGESAADLREFSAQEFVEALFAAANTIFS